jgi:hypothetical protein
MSTCWIERVRARRADPFVPTQTRAEVAVPMGPAAADDAFAWMNRQLSWQSRLAELEMLALRRPRRARTS